MIVSVYSFSDTTRNKCLFSLSSRSEGTVTIFDPSLSPSSLILVYEGFSPNLRYFGEGRMNEHYFDGISSHN